MERSKLQLACPPLLFFADSYLYLHQAPSLHCYILSPNYFRVVYCCLILVSDRSTPLVRFLDLCREFVLENLLADYSRYFPRQ